MLLATCSIAFELHQLNASLRPLNRIPVTNPVNYGHADESREQRIERIARSRIQTRDDDKAIDEKIRELLQLRQVDASSNRQSTSPQAHR